MKNIILTVLTAASLLMFSCNTGRSEKEMGAPTANLAIDKTEYKPDDRKQYQSDTIGTNANRTQQQKKPAQSAANPDWDKKIIKNATLNIEIKNHKTYYATLREKIRSVGGYIAQEEQTLSEYKSENALVIKVPVDQFDDAVAALSTDAEKIVEKRITSQDVTAEFVDTKARMEARRQVRERYLGLLHQAKNMEEILNVQGEINQVQEEIESAAGRIEYLSHSAAYSTINLTYFQIMNVAAKNDDKPNFGTKLVSAFKAGGSWIVELFIGLVTIWPLFLFGCLVFILYKRTRPQKIKV